MVIELCRKAVGLDKYSLARLVTLFERQDATAVHLRVATESWLRAHMGAGRQARLIGWTGAPGAGKSTLLGALALHLIRQSRDIAVAIIAIDPSSHISGGAILGDRTRTRFPVCDARIYFRSQASGLALGGLSRATWPIVRLLSYFFDYIFIETVGIGQSEIEIRHLADSVTLVTQPFAGDQIQFLKSGIMEIPDIFVVNKCDEERLALQSYHQLVSSLQFLEQGEIPVVMTSAVSGRGIDQLADVLREKAVPTKTKREQAFRYFLRKEVERQFGLFGLNCIDKSGINFDAQGSFDLQLEVALQEIRKSIREIR